MIQLLFLLFVRIAKLICRFSETIDQSQNPRIRRKVESLPKNPSVKDVLDQELLVANKLVRFERTNRLKELMDSEKVGYEKELLDIGLSIVKNRS